MDAETFRTGKNPDGSPVQPAAVVADRDKDERIQELLEANNRLVAERRAVQEKLDALALVPDRTIVAQIGKERYVVRLIAHGAMSWGDMDRAGLAEMVRQAQLVLSGAQNWAGPVDVPKEPA